MWRVKIIGAGLIALALTALPAAAQQQSPSVNPDINNVALNPVPFGLWVKDLMQEARARGISESLLQQAFTDIEPDNQIIELDRAQPEGTRSFTDYLEATVSPERVRMGQKKFAENRDLLEKIGRDYGVQPRFIVALWGKETNYGGFTGNKNIIQSLATLAYDGRRSDFFRTELLEALSIVQAGHISLEDMTGSWAGAMGQCQFMPSSFLKFAVDYDGDGRKDIWHSQGDVFASIANYLKQSGWKGEETWGRQVMLPQGFDPSLTDGKHYKPLAEWTALGVKNIDGSSLPAKALAAAITLPGEPSEAAYLIYSNYDVVLKWNRSRYFATAVGVLADHLGGV